MVWSLLYDLMRNTLSVILLRIRSDATKDIEIMALRHQLAVLPKLLHPVPVPHENRIGVPTCEVLRRSGC
jgi:hypothetical protein